MFPRTSICTPPASRSTKAPICATPTSRSANTPICTPPVSPSTTLSTEQGFTTPASSVPELSEDIYDFDSLNQLSSRIFQYTKHKDREPKAILAIRTATKRKLRKIEDAPSTPESLQRLVSGIRDVIGCKWKTLLLYSDRDPHYPDCKKLWNKTEWRKWDVVEYLDLLATQYSTACEQAASEGVNLETGPVDEVLLPLINHLLRLADGKNPSVVTIKQWESPYTFEALKCPGLGTDEMVEADEDHYME